MQGLEGIALDELRRALGKRAKLPAQAAPDSGALSFKFSGNLAELLKLKTVSSVYLVQRHPVPRPLGLLGHQHLTALLGQIETARGLWQKGAFHTFYISAAGAESRVMERLKDELSARSGLAVGSHEGDLLLRIRRPKDSSPADTSPADDSPGWETLVRLSPRPLASRDWRVCNYQGALNACTAHAMNLLTEPTTDERYLNLACGSGGLLIERLSWGAARRAIGIDLDPQALDCARQNLAASGFSRRVTLLRADAADLPLAAGSFDVITADLPFGHLVGSHEQNLALYPLILDEAARLTRRGARLCLISHEVHLLEALLGERREWRLLQSLRVWQGGLHPRIYLLKRL